MIVIGIDPGNSGGIAILAGDSYGVRAMPDTFRGIRDWLAAAPGPRKAYLESVHAMPGEGVNSVATFAENVGALKMACCCLNIPVEMVSPQRWQKALMLPKESAGERPTPRDFEPAEEFKARKKVWARRRAEIKRDKKNAMKRIAQERFPLVKVTLATADALLIADWGRKQAGGVGEVKP